MAKRSRNPRGTSAPTSKSTEPAVSSADRDHMIAEAAYFRALSRGFHGGDPVEDWLAAEREINHLLPRPAQQRRELAAYQALRKEIADRLGEIRENLSAEMVRDTLQRARERLKNAGEHAADTVDKVGASIEKDLINVAQRMGSKWGALSEKTADVFSVWRDRSNIFLGSAARAVSDWLEHTRERVIPLNYRSGEIAAAGTFACTACGERVELSTSAHLPACPKCRRTEFRRL